MYRQIRVREEDCVYQHILWRNCPDGEVQEYELRTVTYGVNAAPFLALRCLRQLDYDDGIQFPPTKGLLIYNTYVDDIIAGADSAEDLLAIQRDLVHLLRRGEFDLKKWASNCDAILKCVPLEDQAREPTFTPTGDAALKVLGVHWDPTTDSFGYHAKTDDMSMTKRSVLSIIARLYDPIGALGPVLLWAKGLMQQLWVEKIGWDSLLPSALRLKWRQFLEELPLLAQVSVPRHINIRQVTEVQLMGFADASQRGYAAIVFLQTTDNVGQFNVHFIACKTKISPLKASQNDTTLTIHRLELCAALLLANLLSNRLKLLKDIIIIDKIQAWTDSTVVLAWITQEQKQFKVLVTNRVTQIRELLPNCEWAHVGTTDNPVDPASRGLLPRDLLACSKHLAGPEFLRQDDVRWPTVASGEFTISMENLPELKTPVQCILHVQEKENLWIERFSSLSRMIRVVGYCIRFGDRVRQRCTSDGAYFARRVQPSLA